MKKLTTIVLILIFVVVVVLPTLAEAMYYDSEDYTKLKSIVFKVGTPFYVVNKTDILMGVSPFLQKDRIYVPVRFLGNAFGITDNNITWDDSTQTVTIKDDNTTLQMTIGQAQIIFNGNIKQIDVPPLLIQGRTFLPARYVAESLGYQVSWDDKNQMLVCWPQGQQNPDINGSINWLNGQSQQTAKPLIPPTNQSTTWMDIGGISQPTGIAVDISGNVYVADQHGKIKKLVNGAWTDITYNEGFFWPTGVAVVDSTGNVYVVDSNNQKIKKLASGSSTWTDITGNGSFQCPHGIAVDSSGNLYVADLLNNKIKKMTQ